MKTYKLTITPQSYLLCSNGDTSSTLDAQFVFDENGFPYFPGKTFKGLLKESMMEVLEIKGETGIESTIQKYFGTEGDDTNKGILEIDNFYLSDYINEILNIASTGLSKQQIQHYFLTRIQQTALDDNEIAEQGSLRTFAVLNYCRAEEFVTEVILPEMEDILLKAILHLRYAGLSRNRGFGKIACFIDNGSSIKPPDFTTPEFFDYLKVSITTIEPIVLGTQNADQNTVNSQDFISGSQVLGLLAWKHFKEGKPNPKELFLSNGLTFSNCYPQGATPLPASIHKAKYKPEPEYYNLLKEKPTELIEGVSESIVTKGIGGFVTDQGKQKVNKSFNFHASRTDRNAGRSTENAEIGGIFYYESINKGQTFEGKISGDKELLTQIVKANGLTFEANIGKSKSSQYGKVSITFEPIKDDSNNTEKEDAEKTNKTNVLPAVTYYLVAQSPLILLNNCGYPMPTLQTLQEALGGIPIESATAGYVAIEQFSGIWGTKTGKFNAYREGSTFKITTETELAPIQQIGAYTERGFGKVKFYSEAEMGTFVTSLQTEDKKKQKGENEANTQQEKKKENITQPETPPTLEAIKAPQTLLDKIKKEVELFQRKTAVEDAGYKLAQNIKYKKLTNSLISRMIEKIGTVTNKAQMTIFLTDKTEGIADKPAGKQLEDAHLIDDLKNSPYSDFVEYKLYWLSFFHALRKANKKQ